MNDVEKLKIRKSYCNFLGRNEKFCGLPSFEKIPKIYYEKWLK